ncbi:AAC(3) family N-acetyltransferase [Listeria newyorkensis]|uniref:Aminoglycoside N(3)-acetyltransferase n=1 Tax=Listeria newyorkensis TaxID=1497681 RepID=A0ABX4XQA3_9LIST|nr:MULTISPECIES: AAC(3) family N-acetyltransferase [Listeria]KGL46195.1 aminoglycoside 3-N-acetyltransferase [Listeriaceae bacterium FSL A5-0209]KGL43414.1 aminoglycoside 3-N-acetyltransferase [Listeria newyorkensis]KMT63031.1 aminoglycoside N3-acetyltransferase [Listeria newyorkensis]PNP88984.1 AAC(3) family N-acetyltransferase [Listeria newyorkensis]RQW65725.1 AAC(3) family N-acetyltransferase [Listeria sp. SHR_NRA_18]
MGEKKAIRKTKTPHTVASICEELHNLGIAKGDTVILHAALGQAGWVCGGDVAIIKAFQKAITESGNLVMASQSTNVSDPAKWRNPAVPKEWWPTIYEEMPAYNPDETPTFFMGVIPETFRKMANVKRSSHPKYSFCAWGSDSAFITEKHALNFGFGEQSPLARLYELHAKIVLFGVDHNKNTSLHLAEHRAKAFRIQQEKSPIMVGGEKVWQSYDEITSNSEEFIGIGRDYEQKTAHQPTTLAGAPTKIFDMRDLVDYVSGVISE